MGFFDRPLFDFNGDGKEDFLETMAGLQMTASSRKEAIELTGDDTFYCGNDSLDDDDDDDDDDDLKLIDDEDAILEEAGLDYAELMAIDDDERREALEDAGLDPDDFDDFQSYK